MIQERPAKNDPTVAIALIAFHAGALGVFVPAFFSWQAIVTAIVLYFLTGMIGVTLGYHRLLTHRSLSVPKPLEYALAFCGILSLQGGPIDWVATHRAHHAHTDEELDPHDSKKGMRWAHIEWMLRPNGARVEAKDRGRWAPDLVKDPVYRFMDAHWMWAQIALGIVLFVFGQAAFHNGWSFVVWAGFFRLVVVFHATWLVNSASHAVGYRSYKTGDRSTNNWWVALTTFGEGWHNNHHAFPFSARHGLRWYEFDPTWIVIRTMQTLKIARNVKLPTREMLDRLDLRRQPKASPSAP